MAEPRGIIANIHLSEKNLKKFLKTPLGEKGIVMDFFVEKMHEFGKQEQESELGIHYDKDKNNLVYWHFEHYYSYDKREIGIFEKIAAFKDSTEKDYAMVSGHPMFLSSLRDVDDLIEIRKNKAAHLDFIKLEEDQLKKIQDYLFETYTEHSKHFPNPNKKNLEVWRNKLFKEKAFFYPSVKLAYYKYEKKKRLEEKPLLIAKATGTNPFNLYKSIYTDGKHVYESYDHYYFEKAELIYENADPHTFEKLSKDLFRDKQHVFHHKKSVQKNVEGIKRKHYRVLEPLKNVDAKNVKIIEGGYWEDGESIFYESEKLKGADAKDYTKKGGFIFSNGHFFRCAKEIKNIDPKSFKFFSNYHYANKGKVYNFEEKELLEADPESFESLLLIPEDVDVYDYHYMGKDKSHVYYHEKTVEGADPSSFKRLDLGTSIDKDHLFGIKKTGSGDMCVATPNSHASTFQSFPQSYFGKDKNQVYYYGSPISGADVDSFEVMKDGIYAKDKNQAYFGAQKLECDLKTFEVVQGFEAKDKNGRFYHGERA